MPLHEQLEYEDLHYTHPRHTLADDKEITIEENVQYIVYGLTLGNNTVITLDSGAEVIVL